MTPEAAFIVGLLLKIAMTAGIVVAASVVIATLAVGAVVFYHYRGPV